jgi:hypothetical protein
MLPHANGRLVHAPSLQRQSAAAIILHRVAQGLDTVLKQRLRAVIDGAPVTEAELRKLFEEGAACALIIDGQLEDGERRLAELAADPQSSLTEAAAAMRLVNELRPDLVELDELLHELDARAREFRTSWLSAY